LDSGKEFMQKLLKNRKGTEELCSFLISTLNIAETETCIGAQRLSGHAEEV
jgi:hypothetical protein